MKPDLVRRFLAARFDPESYLGLRLTLGVLAFVAGVWAFGGLLEEVLDDETLVRWDRAAEAWFHAHATPAGLRAFEAVTQLGSPVVWVLIVLVGLVLARRRAYLLLSVWLAANLGSKVVEGALKRGVHRTRPQYAAAYLNGQSYSFPSGHTMSATVCYVMLAVVLAKLLRAERPARLALYGAALAVIAAVGFSRLYLGVHYPSDVLGGAAAGTAWLAVCLTTYHLASGRG